MTYNVFGGTLSLTQSINQGFLLEEDIMDQAYILVPKKSLKLQSATVQGNHYKNSN